MDYRKFKAKTETELPVAATPSSPDGTDYSRRLKEGRRRHRCHMFVANHIRRQFGVSAEVIAKRLRAEKLWLPSDS